MQDVAIDPPILSLLLRADPALPGQPADVFGMEARKLRRFLGGNPVWQGLYDSSVERLRFGPPARIEDGLLLGSRGQLILEIRRSKPRLFR